MLSKLRLRVGDVQGAGDAEAGFLEDMGVNLGGGNVGVAEEFLDGADIVARLEEVGGKRMPEGMATNGFWDAGE